MASLSEAREVMEFLKDLLDGPLVVGVGVTGAGPSDHGVQIMVIEDLPYTLLEHLTSAVPIPLTVKVTGPITSARYVTE